jgi:segregation and condensation protein A
VTNPLDNAAAEASKGSEQTSPVTSDSDGSVAKQDAPTDTATSDESSAERLAADDGLSAAAPHPQPAAPPPDDAACASRDEGQVQETYRVELENFEGPLDLLLHLIQQHELDIMDIPIAFITERYVAYVMLMQELNIDVASEYLVMAATLAHIKSKMLLPSVPEDQEDGDLEPEEDPRQELVRRLLEYQKYKEAARNLGSRNVFGRDVYARGMSAPEVQGPAPLADIPIFKLLDAFQSVLDRVKKTLDHQVEFERLSITDRINELVDLLKGKRRCDFEDLFEGQRTRADVILTFLALLEMTRLRMTRLVQEGPLAPIAIEISLEDHGDDSAQADLGATAESAAPEAAASEPESAGVAPTAESAAAAQPEPGPTASAEPAESVASATLGGGGGDSEAPESAGEKDY